jgi:hypothetical protein
VQSEIHEFLASVAKGQPDSKFIPLDPGTLATQVGTSRNKVNKTLFNLRVTDKIELERGPNGRSITGFKLLAGPAERKRVARKPGRQRLDTPAVLNPGAPRRRSRGLPTPALDDYALAKQKFGRMRDELGDLVTAEFKTNPYAEEGLMLRDHLASVEEHYAETSGKVEGLERDLRALRRLQNREMAEGVTRGQANVDS